MEKQSIALLFCCSSSLFLSSPPACHELTSVFTHPTLTPIAFSFFLLHMEVLLFSRRAPTSLKRWWMALAPVSISKVKQFRDKTSSSLSYWFSSEFSLWWHCASEWIHEWKHRWMHNTAEQWLKFDWSPVSPTDAWLSPLKVLFKWEFNVGADEGWQMRCEATHVVSYIMSDCVLGCAVVFYSQIKNQHFTEYAYSAGLRIEYYWFHLKWLTLVCSPYQAW